MPRGQKMTLRDEDIRLYEFILSEYRKTFEVPKLETMGAFLGVGVWAARTRLSRLIRAGLVELTHLPANQGPYKLPAGAWMEDKHE